MTLYVDADELKASHGLNGTTYADDDFDGAIAAACSALDRELGMTFGKTATATARLFKPTDAGFARVDDMAAAPTLVRVSATGATADFETWVEDTQYRVEPLNAAEMGEPYNVIHVLSGYYLPLYRDSLLEVTARWGYPSIPAEIKQAAGIVAAQLIRRRREAPFGVIIGTEAAAYISRKDPQVALLLGRFSGRPTMGTARLR